MEPKAETRKAVDGSTEYLCEICAAWVKGISWDGTGYTQIICPGCCTALDADFLFSWERERGLYTDEEIDELIKKYYR